MALYWLDHEEALVIDKLRSRSLVTLDLHESEADEVVDRLSVTPSFWKPLVINLDKYYMTNLKIILHKDEVYEKVSKVHRTDFIGNTMHVLTETKEELNKAIDIIDTESVISLNKELDKALGYLLKAKETLENETL